MKTISCILLLSAAYIAKGEQTSTCGGTNFGGFVCQDCADIDECAIRNGDCDPNATCNNTIGSFTCSCNDGYAGDGKTCTDIDECETMNGYCDANALCTNTPGSRTCTCNAGYTGTGVECTDMNEVLLPNDTWACATNDVLRDLTNVTMWNSGLVTLENCAKSCKTLGYPYAGANNGNNCYCGSYLQNFVEGENCDVVCEGNTSQICGGTNDVSVTGFEAATVGTFAYSNLGCFADMCECGDGLKVTDPLRDLPSYTFWGYGSMTLTLCARSCYALGYRYAGVEWSSYCSCGNSYGRHGESTNCVSPCSGDGNEVCGGVACNTILLISE